jgi:DivIVA domain-containing protein
LSDLSPEDIEGARFPRRARGYDRERVEAFLRRVAEELRRARSRPKGAEPYRQLGEEIGGFLQHAKDAAESLRGEAERELEAALQRAEGMVERARREAEELKRDAQREADELRARADLDAESARNEAARLKRLARADATVVAREAKRTAAEIRDRAQRQAEKIRAAAQRDAQLQTERTERKVRRLQDLEFALAQRVSAAEARLEAQSSDASETG